MSTTDALMRAAVGRAKPLLDRFGILGSPLRDAVHARRALTVERPVDEVGAFLSERDRAAELFRTGGQVEVRAKGKYAVEWTLGSRGSASARLREGPDRSTEIVLEVELERLADGARPRYADNAGVIALRALHRAKSLIETGEAASLAANPAARPAADPYGD